MIKLEKLSSTNEFHELSLIFSINIYVEVESLLIFIFDTPFILLIPEVADSLVISFF